MQSAEPFDPQSALVMDWRTYFTERRKERFLFKCIEGPVEMTGAWVVLNIIFTYPLIKRHRGVNQHHLMTSGIYDSKSHADHMSRVLRSLENYGYTREEIAHDIFMSSNMALNMCYTHLPTYACTINIFNIADTILQPEVKEICTPDYGDITDGNINRMEAIFKLQCEKVDEILSGDTLPVNVFRGPLICGALKKGQFFQFVLSAGPRTDTDDHMFLKPVVGSFLSGMRDEHDLAIESRSAAKATHYSNTQMPLTSYNSRKVHIQTSQIRYVYPGDCGSTVYVTYPKKFFSGKTLKFFYGKYFVNDSGVLEELTASNADKIKDRDTQFRDPTTCRYTDGYCETCGGTISKSLTKNGNVGLLANCYTGSPVQQFVLSTKHLISTNSLEYEIPDILSEYLVSDTNKIYLKPQFAKTADEYVLGFRADNVAKLNDLRYTNVTSDIKAQQYSNIVWLTLGKLDSEGNIAKVGTQVNMGGAKKIYPNLSTEVLSVIRDNPDSVVVKDKMVWLRLGDIDPQAPIMECTVVNDSIRGFVRSFSTLLAKDVERYTSINDFMASICDLIWSPGREGPSVDAHVTHLSTLTKACMITSKSNFDIPQVQDPDDVQFGALMRNIPRRSLGGLLAFQNFNLTTNKPSTFIIPRRHGVFDEFIGYSDIIERDSEWPPHTDKLTEEPM